MNHPAGIADAAAAYGTSLSLPGACGYCSSPFSAIYHAGPCPRIRAIEYHPCGTVKRVELHDLQPDGRKMDGETPGAEAA